MKKLKSDETTNVQEIKKEKKLYNNIDVWKIGILNCTIKKLKSDETTNIQEIKKKKKLYNTLPTYQIVCR